MNRRAFLQRGAAAAGMAAAPWFVPASVLGAEGTTPPSERIGVGVIGIGAMGSGHVSRMLGDPGVQLVGVCDVDATRRTAAQGRAEQKQGAAAAARGCRPYNDYRELLARPELDAVVIATPDHWHTLQSIDAAKAGKDVYCEKPISITLQEGRRLAEAVRRYGRVFQTGTQYRSIPTVRQVCQFVRTGGLGRVKAAFTILDPVAGFLRSERFKPYASAIDPEKYTRCYTPIDVPLPGEPAPEGLDWELWVGPGPFRPYHSLYHKNPSPGVVPWSFCDGYGVVSITWHLSHSTDVIQYALGMETSGPVEIVHPSTQEFPTLTCRYANGALLHFVDHWGMVKDVYHAVPADARLAGLFGGVFVGEEGWVTSMSTGGPIEGGPAGLFERLKLTTREVNIGQNNHHANWLECIRTRAQPSCHEEIGHRSASLGHLALVSHRLGCSLKWDPAKEEFLGNEEANRLRARALREPWRI